MLTASRSYGTTDIITFTVEKLLKECGIKEMNVKYESTRFPETMEWSIGTDLLSIINELLAMINYEELWFNSDGMAICQPAEDAKEENAKHVYSDTDIGCLMERHVTDQLDIFDAPNQFIVYCSNPEKSAVWSVVETNDSPGSSLSTVRRGRTIATKVRVNNIASLTHLQVYARLLRIKSSYASELIGITTALEPGHGVGDICGVTTQLATGYGRETEWRMNLISGGSMTHTLERMVT